LQGVIYLLAKRASEKQHLQNRSLCRWLANAQGISSRHAASVFLAFRALAGTHPDIEIVQKPAERTTIPLEALIGSPDQRLRAGLCWRLLLRPQLASRKFAVLLDADHLSEEAANCLLKTLEETTARGCSYFSRDNT